MRLKELLIQYETDNEKNHNEVAKELGVSLSTYYRWLNGESTMLKKGTIEKLSSVLNYDIETVIMQEERIKPIAGFVKAGYDLLADENIEGYIELGQADASRGDYFVRICGDSMTGSHIYDGDLVYVAKSDTASSGQIAVVLVGDEVTLKKVYYKNDLMILEASNPEYESRFFTKEEIVDLPVRIMGIARFVRRDFN